MSIPVITIDGPSGAGKGTICRIVSEKTGYHLLDSGALYRLTALAAIKGGIDLDNEEEVTLVAKGLDIAFQPNGDSTLVMLDGRDVSADIRQENIGMGASVVAAYPAVRSALLQRQRDFVTLPGLVADGRDMGTVVFPHAPVKVFLTASAEERARRRVKQLQLAGEKPDYATILTDIQSRDQKDSSRKTAPLLPAEDAVQLDSTALAIDEVVAVVMSLVTENLAHA